MNYKYFFLCFPLLFFSACFILPQSEKRTDVDEDMTQFPCHQMGGKWMGDCTFDSSGKPIMPEDAKRRSSGEEFSNDISGLPEAKASEIVKLENGDMYAISAGYVQQEVGNRIYRRLAYNGQIPGPLLRVPKNAEITIKFTNNLDIETTIHSHGLRLGNSFDGVPDVTQPSVKPGESFSYTLKFPDEGIYWYHPHIREDYTQEMGLFGNFLVDPNLPDYWNPVSGEQVLVLDDFLENEPFYKDTTSHTLMGRFGNMFLINNQENYEMTVKKGDIIRFYITNVSNTRTFDISLPGAQIKLVGGDIGRIEQEYPIKNIIIAPAERMVGEVLFDAEGEIPILHRGEKIGKIMVSAENSEIPDDIELMDEKELLPLKYFGQFRKNNADYAFLRSRFDTYLKEEPKKELVIDIDMAEMENVIIDEEREEELNEDGGIEWENTMEMMNASSNDKNTKWILRDKKTGKENMDINWTFPKGALIKIRILHDPDSVHSMQHPIHFHGQRFVVLSRNGEPNRNLQWKDTALIKKGETVDILLEMSNPGKWMAHCHIAEHLGSEMMFAFTVKE